MTIFNTYKFLDYVALTVDLTLIWFIFYHILLAARGTKAIQLFTGLLLIIGVKGISNFFRLQMLESITTELLTWGFLSVIIIFQPEIRRGLEGLGRAKFLTIKSNEEVTKTEHTIKEISQAVQYMAKRHIGALITIERGTGLKEYIDTGVAIKGKITTQLLINIFIPNTPLHDGAVILSESQISAAGCYLPLSESSSLSKSHGTRHRAAVGISEASDAITLVVSEESGEISVTKSGVLHHNLDISNMESMLRLSLITAINKKQGNFWKRNAKKNE